MEAFSELLCECSSSHDVVVALDAAAGTTAVAPSFVILVEITVAILVSRDPILAGLKAERMASSLSDQMAASLASSLAGQMALSLAVHMTASLVLSLAIQIAASLASSVSDQMASSLASSLADQMASSLADQMAKSPSRYDNQYLDGMLIRLIAGNFLSVAL